MITAGQTIAARGLLGWKQSNLSDAIKEQGGKLSVTAITTFERGGAIRKSNNLRIRKALETQGIQFLENGDTALGDGVVLKVSD